VLQEPEVPEAPEVLEAHLGERLEELLVVGLELVAEPDLVLGLVLGPGLVPGKEQPGLDSRRLEDS